MRGPCRIQGQLRHSDAEITRNVYMQQVAPETYQAVVNLERLADETKVAKDDHADAA
jgi:hypothetical protein